MSNVREYEIKLHEGYGRNPWIASVIFEHGCGCAGFGATPAEALMNLCAEWFGEKPMTPEQRRNINHVKTLIRNMRAGGRIDEQIKPWLLSQGWAAGAVKAAMEELGREP